MALYRAEVHILENEAESREYFLQMWAEIMELYRNGNYFLTLPKHLAAELAKYQSRFTPEDSRETQDDNLKSQFATSSWGGKRKLPYAFTEQGIYMLATVLKGELAEQQSIFIMRAFKEMRHFIANN